MEQAGRRLSSLKERPSEHQNGRRSIKDVTAKHVQEFRKQENKTSRKLQRNGDGIQALDSEKQFDLRRVWRKKGIKYKVVRIKLYI